MKRIFTAIGFIMGISLTANAGILIEPYIGYEMGDVQYDLVGPTNEITEKGTGTGYGLRLGYKILAPWVALDYTGSSGTLKPDSGTDHDYTTTGLAAVVGVDLPLIRAWAGYGFSNEATRIGTNGEADWKFKGTYTKVGVGFGFIPFVSVNAEYKMNSYSKVDIDGTTNGEVSRGDIFEKLKNDVLMFSVSIPFNL